MADDKRDVRQRKAEWMNEQLAERLRKDQAGVAPAPNARPDDAFAAEKPRKAADKA